jgi:hypothetical protein
MLLMALMGEERVRTFGQTSYGMSTANATYPLPDGATLVLTQSRYALGNGPVFRGGIPPMRRRGNRWTRRSGRPRNGWRPIRRVARQGAPGPSKPPYARASFAACSGVKPS